MWKHSSSTDFSYKDIAVTKNRTEVLFSFLGSLILYFPFICFSSSPYFNPS